jgi:hypothetical protein
LLPYLPPDLTIQTLDFAECIYVFLVIPATGIKLVFVVDRQNVSSQVEAKFLVAFVVLRKAISFVMSVCPSAWNYSAPLDGYV